MEIKEGGRSRSGLGVAALHFGQRGLRALVDAALQFGFAEGSAQCAICALKIGENIDYWIEIADTCSKFAQQIKKLDS